MEWSILIVIYVDLVLNGKREYNFNSHLATVSELLVFTIRLSQMACNQWLK